MAAGRLLVERGAIRDPSQDWGVYEFVSMPSPGDRIAVPHEGSTHYLTVLCVHHRPVRVDDATGQAPNPPGAEVVAKWTGSTESRSG